MESGEMEQVVEIRVEESGPVLALKGTLGIRHAREFRALALTFAYPLPAVTVDCSALVHLDTAALQVLLSLKAMLHRRGKVMRLDGVQPQVLRYLELAGVTGLLGGGEA